MTDHETYLGEAVALAEANVAAGGSPYGAVIVRDGAVLVRAANTVHATHDPSAHAEMVALREASRLLGNRDLSDCVMYASGRPCPMCHAAMRLAGFREGYFRVLGGRGRGARRRQRGALRRAVPAAGPAADAPHPDAAGGRGALRRVAGSPRRLSGAISPVIRGPGGSRRGTAR